MGGDRRLGRRRSSARERSLSPITCFHLAMTSSVQARFVYPNIFCQLIRLCPAMSRRCRSRCVGSASAIFLGTAIAAGRRWPPRVAHGHAIVDAILIVPAVADERGQCARYLVEQGIGLVDKI